MQIIDSYNAAVELQVGHGGWNDRMEDVCCVTACFTFYKLHVCVKHY